MYKIVIRTSSGQVKKKFYESEKDFRKWLATHTRRYSNCYNVLGYELVSLNPNVWERRTA